MGQPYVVTRSEGNRIENAGRSIERVQDTAPEVSEEDRSLMRAGLHRRGASTGPTSAA